MALKNKACLAAGALALAGLCGAPAQADVKAGVDAWSQGNYAGAVHEWEGPAAAGDPDAMFNLAQAYRLGRGVPEDLAKAELYYAKAAAAGHIQAADTYGLMLFQDGRREQALPYVEDAARRGDPRSQYLLGIAHFNGDLVSRDWIRAYALVSLANAQGLPQAAPAVRQMDGYIPLDQRQKAAGLAQTMQREADSARATELAAAELGTQVSEAAIPARQPTARPAADVAMPAPHTAVSPSIAAARAAVAEASQATGTESPADAGATYARNDAAPARPAPVVARPEPVRPEPVRPPPQQPVVVARTDPAPSPPVATQPRQVPAAPAPQPVASGPWRVQLGAFSVSGNAERLWSRLSSRSELAGHPRLLVPAGRVTKLQAGGFASRGEAETACRSLKSSGQDCLVTRD